MEIILGGLFFLFMLLVDWRLSRIHRELTKISKRLDQSKP